MPQIAFFECAWCENKLSAEVPQRRCPLDSGPLLVRYHPETLPRSALRDAPARYALDSPVSLGMWRYRDLLPDTAPVTLGEGWTPMVASIRHKNLLVKNEATNPTGSVEDRAMSLTVSMACHYGLRGFTLALVGEVPDALATYAARAGMELKHLLPRDTVASPEAWCDAAAFSEPFRIEASKTIGYEIVEGLGWRYPGAVLYCDPEGFGVLGISKALAEIEALGWVEGPRPRIYALGTPSRGGSAVAELLRESQGRTVLPGEAAILAALRAWAAEGISLSRGGASAAAAYEILVVSGEIRPDEQVVLVEPGSGRRHPAWEPDASERARPRVLPTSLPVGGIITPV